MKEYEAKQRRAQAAQQKKRDDARDAVRTKIAVEEREKQFGRRVRRNNEAKKGTFTTALFLERDMELSNGNG